MAADQVMAAPKRRETVSQFQVQQSESFSFAGYRNDGFYDEMFDNAGQPRPDCQPLHNRIRSISSDDLIRRQKAADRSMVQLGITFNVYGDRQATRNCEPVSGSAGRD